jgi:hypothetical protein
VPPTQQPVNTASVEPRRPPSLSHFGGLTRLPRVRSSSAVRSLSVAVRRTDHQSGAATADCLSRQSRFQTLFQLPNSAGNARQVMVGTVK